MRSPVYAIEGSRIHRPTVATILWRVVCHREVIRMRRQTEERALLANRRAVRAPASGHTGRLGTRGEINKN